MKKGGGLSPYSANCFTIYGISEVGLGNVSIMALDLASWR